MPVSVRVSRLAAGVVLAGLLVSPALAQGTEPMILPPQDLAPPARGLVAPGPVAPLEPARPAVAPPPAARPAVAAAKPPAPPVEARISQDPQPTLRPDSASLALAAGRRYAEIVARGGWPSVPEGPLTKPGQSAAHIPAVRSRLAAEGDDGGDLASPVLDAPLAAAVKRFQVRHGLPDTGIVGPATVKAMNVPAEARERALLYSADRLANLDFAFGPRHVVVNIPSAAVEAVEDGAVARRYVAVVGDPKHPSPTVTARIGAINLNPTWTLPVSIVKNEIIPKMRKDPATLAKQRIRIFGASGQEIDPARIDWSTNAAVNYTLRQDSGPGNALGQLRIAMPNRHDVYMHDTPSKRHFASERRFLSHGCVRVSGVLDLAAWILAPQGFNRATLEAVQATGERKDIGLPKAVPVAWVYLTGWATPDGAVHFRDDIYGLDRPDPLDELVTATIAER
jgi:murein L,D-transpeptidase YcbB/YkuD